ncbi:MAG: T9SS type A sorting domain-containing protein [Chitinophagaceae bacterium]
MKNNTPIVKPTRRNKFFVSTIFSFFILIIGVQTKVWAQMQNNGNLYIASGGNMYVKTSFTNLAPTYSISAPGYVNDGSLTITGDFTNSEANLANGNGTTTFAGTTQNIAGSSNADFNNVVINPGSTVTQITTPIKLSVTGNWTNNGTFIPNGKTVSIDSNLTTHLFIGNTTFNNLTLNGSTDFGTTTITIGNTLQANIGTMGEGTSTFIFTGASGSIGGSNNKNFYDVQIISGASLSDLTASAGDVHIKNSYTNNGTFSQYNTHTTYFDRSNAIETLAGNGSTTFGNLTIGGPILSNPTTLNAGSHSFTVSGNSFKFNSSGSSFNGNTATVTFSLTAAGTSTVSKSSGVTGVSANFYNVNINPLSATVATAVDFGANLSTINNTLQINTNGSVINNAPTYATGSLLLYYTGGSYTRGTEWSTSTNPGYPYNVQVSNSTYLNIGGSNTVQKALANNFTIDAGSTLDMQALTAALVAGNNIQIDGTLKLSTSSGGDAQLNGNWINNGTFTPNGRVVNFNGNAAQLITGTNATIFDYLTNNNTTAASVTINKDVTVNQILTTANSTNLSIGSNTLTLAGTITGSGTLAGSSTSNLTINGFATPLGTLIFKTASQSLNNFTLNRTGITNNYAVLLGSSLSANSLTLTKGIVATGSNLFTWNNSGGILTAPNTPWVAHTANFADSYIATCDASGTPIPESSTVPFTGNVGFRVNNVGPTSGDVYFPVGASFLPAGTTVTAGTPNRLMINNTHGTNDNFTVVVNYGDIGGTPKPKVNRVWYVNANNANDKATMRLFFVDRDPSLWPTQQNEVENLPYPFDYTQIVLVEKDYAAPANFIAMSGAGDYKSFPHGNYTDEEVYAQYSYGVSPDINGVTNGITQFNRFSITNPGGIILPVTIVNFKAYQQGSNIQVDWTSLNEVNISHYEVEKSLNGTNFTTIGTEAAIKNGQPYVDYRFTDIHPASGNNFYRIKVVNADGTVAYTNIADVVMGEARPNIAVYPNPVTIRNFTVQLTNLPAGKYTLQLYNNLGQLIISKTVEHPGGSASQTIYLPASVARGAYTFKFANSITRFIKTLIIQ